MKKCFKCAHFKTLDSFYKHAGMLDGHLNKCKSCTKADSAAWQKKNPERSKELKTIERHKKIDRYYKWRIKKQYGLTVEQYEALLKTQSYKCAICPKELLNLETRLHVDHSHSTGKVRGLLCRGCNTGLGMFKDNFDSLLKAAKYIQEHEGII